MEESKLSVIQEETQHLINVQKEINEQLFTINNKIKINKEEIIQQKRHLWENIYELDPQEIISNRINIEEDYRSFDLRENRKRILLKLLDSSYFGKIDFIYDGEENVEHIYIGLGGLRSQDGSNTIIYDWRAPISSVFYDFDLGSAFYRAPIGTIESRSKTILTKNAD